jgi:hypothetical protein
MAKRSPTTKDIGLLHQLYESGQLTLAPEFQRNSVWPSAAKAYLIDTILNDRPIPLLFFQRTTSPQSGRQTYTVIDGQQRLRAIFEFLDDRYRLANGSKKYSKKRFSEIASEFQDQITNYDLIIQEISGYSDNDIRDMFVRINRYVVQLSPQELRHAKGSGRFHDYVERLGKEHFWKDYKIYSSKMLQRMRAVEFAAELTILLIEGPQDKKSSVDLYYGRYQHKFGEGSAIESKLKNYFSWIAKALPNFASTRYRKPVDLYSLIGALDLASEQGTRLSRLSPTAAGSALLEFEKRTKIREPTGDAARYVAAASRQTDNLTPRTTRIEILNKLVRA